MPTVTCRSLLRAAPLAGAGSLPLQAAADADTPIMQLFREWDAFQAHWNDTGNRFSEAESDAMYQRLTVIEDRIEAEPVTGLLDLAAKFTVSTTYGDFGPSERMMAECEAILAGGPP